ncbi:DUF6137 domain-containing protein [Photorhabdus tasmaniensis]|uniref:Acyl carrier protein n=1 Tax=Photorhabdus tasmaniensis TaxID=1004159 RepID=A0ABX0GNF3_9GAMM|nr:DUF6137 domain-containing protein [Photorhabdus tasmaniensis]NHB90072.1 hypothetical protein [Photorhabdus tasmaniensis]
MSISVSYIRQLIIKIACETTGDDVEELIKLGRLEIPARDAIEFMVRLEALLDCTLGWSKYEHLSMKINNLAEIISKKLNAQSSDDPMPLSP